MRVGHLAYKPLTKLLAVDRGEACVINLHKRPADLVRMHGCMKGGAGQYVCREVNASSFKQAPQNGAWMHSPLHPHYRYTHGDMHKHSMQPAPPTTLSRMSGSMFCSSPAGRSCWVCRIIDWTCRRREEKVRIGQGQGREGAGAEAG